MKDIDALINEALTEEWYYTAELRKDEYTRGFSFNNIALTRKAIAAVDVSGKNVLDVSTMEGMFPIIMSRRGAHVVATDVVNVESRVKLLQSIYDVSFDYRPDSPVQNFVENIYALQALRSFSLGECPLRCSESKSAYGFDVILASGLIYHVNNPIDHLLNYRRLLKSGGICILETSCLVSNHIEIVHEWYKGSQTYAGNATWHPSTKALEVFLKACFFEPLGFVYLSHSDLRENLARIAIVSRAVSVRPFSSDDQEIIGGSELYKNYDYSVVYPSAQLTGECETAPAVKMDELHRADDLSGDKVLEYPTLDYTNEDLCLKLSDL